jgi:hypothetical protein
MMVIGNTGLYLPFGVVKTEEMSEKNLNKISI